MNRFITIMAAAMLVVSMAGCSGGTTSETLKPFVPESGLKRFSSCTELSSYIINTARAEYDYGAYVGVPVRALPEGPSAGITFAPDAMADAVAPEYTGTNVQVAGVDEPDFVKTDGLYIYVLSGGHLTIASSWPPEGMAELSRARIEGSPVAMFIEGDMAVTFSHVYTHELDLGGFAPNAYSLTKATLFDVTDRAAPSMIREIYVEGSYADARLVNGRVHMVVDTFIYMPIEIYPLPGGLMPAGTAAALDAGPELDRIFPRMYDIVNGIAPVTRPVAGCGDVYKPATNNGTGVMSLLTLDTNAPLGNVPGVSAMGANGIVYASGSALYTASVNSGPWLMVPFVDGEPRAPQSWTYVHKFDLGPTPSYAASGRVQGFVLNQFSMDENAGHLRMATSTPAWITGALPVNTLYVLDQQGSDLEEVGRLGGLGKPGESIYAVRMLQDRGFVVTFERRDPLYTLDLSDPLVPARVGELAVPGFSTYLHPLDAGHLLAIGQNTDDWGIDLSIFDVSDMASPSLVAREPVGMGSFSEAMYNHKAFTYFDTLGMLAIPVTAWTNTPDIFSFAEVSMFSGMYVYGVDTAAGFTLLGKVDHENFYKDTASSMWYWPEPVSRGMFIGNATDGYYLYSISGRGIKATGVDDFTTDVSALALPHEPIYWIDRILAGPPMEGF